MNILIHKGVLKLCDFGISKKLEDTSKAYTNNWSNIDYMSPEMLLGEGYDFSVDIWQFGIICYYLTGLKHPFRPSDMRKYQKIVARRKIKTAEYKRIDEQYSEDLRDLLKHTIHIDKDERWTPK